MEYNKYGSSSRTAVSTAEFDEKNFNAVSDIAEIATQQLKNFDQSYKTQLETTNEYKKFRDEVIGEVETQTQTSVDVDLDFEEFMPSLKEKVEETEAVEEVASEKVAFSLSLKGKLLIAVCSSIMALLGILLIYNAVLIGSYTNQIVLSQETVAEMENLTYTLQEQLNTMENSFEFSPEGMGMGKDISQTSTANKINRQEKINYQNETNWFDSVCEFISGIFGG